MDISVQLEGPLVANVSKATGTAWVTLRKKGGDDFSAFTIFVPNHEAAQRIADAINAAFESEAV